MARPEQGAVLVGAEAEHGDRIHFSGAGRRRSAWARRSPTRFRRPRPCSTRSTRRSARSSPTIMWERPGEDADPDRERAAGADGGVDRGAARAGGRGRNLGCKRREVRRRPFARRIFGARRRRRLSISDAARLLRIARHARCRRRCRSAPARWRRCSGLELDAARSRSRAEAAQGEVCDAANDNGGGQVVVSGNKAAVERAVEIAKAQGRQARRCCCRSPRRSIAPDAARRRRDGGGAVPKVDDQASRSCRVVANVLASADHRSGRDPPTPGRAGDRHGALARDAWPTWRATASRDSSRSAPARC